MRDGHRTGRFITQLEVRYTPPWSDDYRRLRSMTLLWSLTYIDRQGRRWMAPAGFKTDGPSVPRFLRWAVPARERTIWAGIIHDYLIRYSKVSDREADRIFYEALRDSGVNVVEACYMWAGVRVASGVRAFERLIGHRGWVRR
jgi:hypothetical protein